MATILYTNIIKTYNPIIKKENIDKFSLSKTMPAAQSGTAIVLSKELPNLQLSLEDIGERRITKSDIFFTDYKAAYYIDTSKRQLEFECVAPGKSGDYDFIVSVSLHCTVRNNKAVIINGLTDVSTYIAQYFKIAIEGISSCYDISEVNQVRNEINRNSSRLVDSIKEFCLYNIFCDLRLSDEARRKLEEATKMKVIEDLISENELKAFLVDYANGGNRGEQLLSKLSSYKNEKLNNEIKTIQSYMQLLDNLKERGLINNENIDGYSGTLLDTLFGSLRQNVGKKVLNPQTNAIEHQDNNNDEIKERLKSYEVKSIGPKEADK